MNVILIKKRYKLPDKESWVLKINDRWVDLIAWRQEHEYQTDRTWIKYFSNEEATRNSEIEKADYLPIYISLDESNPTQTIETFYKLLLLQ